MEKIRFLDENGTFELRNPEAVSGLYFPLASETGLKSAIAPDLAGDSKLDQESFLLEPVSIEDLRNSRGTRNFWCVTEKGCWSASGVSAEQEAARFTPDQDESVLTAGFLWQTVRRTSRRYGLQAELTAFVPPDENVEILEARVTNRDAAPQRVTGVAAVPIYGRSADNLRDHRNVTSMLHRIRTTKYGVQVKPTMSFDEKGHRENRRIYYVCGTTGNGGAPAGFYPTVQEFVGEGGTFLHPRAVCEDREARPAGMEIDGREAMGGIRFPEVTLGPGETSVYLIFLGITEDAGDMDRILTAYGTEERVHAALERTKAYWQEKVNVRYQTGSADFDRLMRWVSLQPLLRRIYGCSFLPHHDYGRGGRGWRDLWQDCLSLLLMDPGGVGEMIQASFGGVRMDGTNATIIGEGLGNFIADRNGIARVWMDHALWPLMTTKLYIDQTGDLDILRAKVSYFKDPQAMRGTEIDGQWDPAYGNRQRTASGEVYTGSILEHLLIQHLTWKNVELAEELEELLRTPPMACDDLSEKKAVLERYTRRCAHNVSGGTIRVLPMELAENLEGKADWLMEHIRRQEWIADGRDGWFNSYYDNHGQPLEGIAETGARMMLTGQVFAIMSGTATEEQVKAIARSADKYLYKKEEGGYRLNTDFHELKFDMGRMFGFAYGEKENGAVFSHMTVMYANALYRRGFVQEGYKALQTLADAALDFESSKIYPGIPEYFNAEGRGMYHYLTGAASWYMLTVITEAFGVRGENGSLAIAPKLVREQFGEAGTASLALPFAGKRFQVIAVNLSRKDYGEYRLEKAYLTTADGPQMRRLPVAEGRVLLDRALLDRLPVTENQITVELM